MWRGGVVSENQLDLQRGWRLRADTWVASYDMMDPPLKTLTINAGKVALPRAPQGRDNWKLCVWSFPGPWTMHRSPWLILIGVPQL